MLEGKAFVEALTAKAKMLSGSAVACCKNHDEIASWLLDPLARWARAAYGDEIFAAAARGYAQYCMHVAQAKARYEKAGKYTPHELPKIKEEVYDDSSYMTPYMWAAVLIYPFWPSMVNHIRLFRDEFLDQLTTDPKLIELACGHGVMGLLALEHRQDAQLVGYDISGPAVEIANRLAGVTPHAGRAKFAVQDVLELPPNDKEQGYDGVVAAMLAEHLVDPRPLFTSVSELLAPGGLAFFSTALESPQVDHVYEFHRESEPLLMAEEVGLRVVRAVCDQGLVKPEFRFSARALAMILQKR